MITVAGVAISGGHIYVGQRMKPSGQESGGYYDDGSEASLIDDTCKIKPTSYLYEDSSLGYWPSFSSLSPEARGAYVSSVDIRPNYSKPCLFCARTWA